MLKELKKAHKELLKKPASESNREQQVIADYASKSIIKELGGLSKELQANAAKFDSKNDTIAKSIQTTLQSVDKSVNERISKYIKPESTRRRQAKSKK